MNQILIVSDLIFVNLKNSHFLSCSFHFDFHFSMSSHKLKGITHKLILILLIKVKIEK